MCNFITRTISCYAAFIRSKGALPAGGGSVARSKNVIEKGEELYNKVVWMGWKVREVVGEVWSERGNKGSGGRQNRIGGSN